MILLAILVIGIAAGWLAQIVLGGDMYEVDWTLAFVAGIAGSFVGGMLGSLLFGDGLKIHASGLLGSFIGALIVTAGYHAYRRRAH
ncbi:MAG: GlsB/YeaQ/YmgE family stress response membrane protein [Actinobacteria bacterium]|nr:GlsB/YeaQ/YmgE family stress response membrane protein [Actinomycetota bacterium]MCB9388843.1 GlsB/YeaQ/YmgE family stress response membrane protein [Acidimicrobiia bacterium]